MVHLYDLIKRSELQSNLDMGYVREVVHPEGFLRLYNYTERAQFDNEWNDATEQCRGLIVDFFTDEVVARPFRKFFNWSQLTPNTQSALMSEPVEAYVKWDGSLGVLYPLHTGEFRIATRGSFTSPQAQHATKVLRERYPAFKPVQGVTYLFEIIYPANRIVVDYKDMDDLVLLAVIDNATGHTLPWGHYDWLGPVNRPARHTSLADVLEAEQEENAEGFVVYFRTLDLRVKIKFDEYVRLHRILTNVSSYSVWDALANGQGVDAWISHVPDEFYTWVHQQVHALEAEYERILTGAQEDFEWIMRRVKRPEWDVNKRRKEFALLANETPHPGILFGLYDEKDIAPRIWKQIKPEYSKPFANQSEDAA